MARSAGSSKDAKKLVRALRKKGYKLAFTGSHHAAVYDAEGNRIQGAGFSMTPPRSYDIRDRAIPRLRRAGIEISYDDL